MSNNVVSSGGQERKQELGTPAKPGARLNLETWVIFKPLGIQYNIM